MTKEEKVLEILVPNYGRVSMTVNVNAGDREHHEGDYYQCVLCDAGSNHSRNSINHKESCKLNELLKLIKY